MIIVKYLSKDIPIVLCKTICMDTKAGNNILQKKIEIIVLKHKIFFLNTS